MIYLYEWCRCLAHCASCFSGRGKLSNGPDLSHGAHRLTKTHVMGYLIDRLRASKSTLSKEKLNVQVPTKLY